VLRLAELCAYYRVLPSQLLSEDANLLYQMAEAQSIAGELKRDARRWSGRTWRVVQLDRERQRERERGEPTEI